MNIRQRLRTLALSLALPVVALAAGQPAAAQTVAPQSVSLASPLIQKVRQATARYVDINVALAEGFVRATPCVSGPNTGAMGVHLVLPSRIGGAVPSGDQPQALIYEPLPGGVMRFVGVEFIVIADAWASQQPAGSGPPALEGHLLNFVDAPNRYGLPAFYEMHVWAWEHNPVGSFADWNTRVTCEHQPAG
jgi:hypothetical protein